MGELNQVPRQYWATRLGVILAVAGSAVGLGNFLRFPGVAVANGGGAFMIPYIVCFLLIGLPVVWSEWSMGRLGGRQGYNSAPSILRATCSRKPGTAYFGLLGLLIPVVIYMYYINVQAWCLAFAWKYWSGGMAAVAASGGESTAEQVGAVSGHILAFAGAYGHGQALSESFWSGPAPWVMLAFVLNFILIYRGINKGIEWFCRWAMPALLLCALIILVRVLTLGTPDPAVPERNVIDGLGFMWNPVGHAVVEVDGQASVVAVPWTHTLLDPGVWLAAAGQIFFSLSIGFGVILTYASYLRRRDDLALSSTSAAAGNGFAEICLGGLIVIPAVFLFVPLVDVVSAGAKESSLSMGFMALPGVFYHMPMGNAFGGLFFFLLSLAAITSSLSMLQPAIAFLEEGLGLNRQASVVLLGVITVVGAGLVLALSGGLVALDQMDFWVGNFLMLVMATIQVILFGWVLGPKRGLDELGTGAHVGLPPGLGFMLRWGTPSLLLVILFGWVATKLLSSKGDAYITGLQENWAAQVAMGYVVLIAIMFALFIHIAVRRWQRLESAGVLPIAEEDQP